MLKRIPFFLLTNLYIYSLIYIYINFSYPKYAYLGWQINPEINYLTVFMVAILSSLFVFFIKRKVEGPLEVLVLISYLIIYLPSINLALICMNSNQSVLSLFFAFTVSLIILISVSRVETPKIKVKALSEKSFNRLFYGLLFFMFAIVFFVYKPEISNFTKLIDFSDVYDLREGYREVNKNVPTIVNYFFTWIIKVFIPLLFVIGIIKQSIKIKILSLLMIFCMFLVSGHKSIILGFGLILLINQVIKKDKLDVLNIMKYLIYLVLFSTLLAFLNIHALQEVVIRRAMLVPGMLSNMYYNYFNVENFTYMGYSFLSFIVDYNFDKTPPYIIGEYYFNRSEMSANVNYLAAAYADFGLIGTILISLICAVYFKFLNGITKEKKLEKLSIMVSIVPMWALLDSAFFTVLVTHGLIWILVLFILMPKGYLND